MFTRKPKIPLAAGLFGRKTHPENEPVRQPVNDEAAPDGPHQTELNRKAVAFTTHSEDDLAA